MARNNPKEIKGCLAEFSISYQKEKALKALKAAKKVEKQLVGTGRVWKKTGIRSYVLAN
ncbi:hypothetical protein [Tenacibaculum soleae]|uniref:hypothetical protein n=1 Tax=Tenacibaculum soleae TaxID=447689 RepID=UPI002301363F|nr:hypothetical protein [Tenacibaculum soleae]